tara:strand:+ start:974 stop:2800 length:1827 start_codon:yes stop_codon:yes gene_type:complete
MITLKPIRNWISGLLIISAVGYTYAQDGIVVDQYGTEYAEELLPPSIKSDVAAYQAGIDSGAAAVDRSGGQIYLPAQTSGLSTEALVDRLTGVVLVPSPGDVIPAGIPGVQGIWHDLEDFPPSVGNSLNAYLGQPVSLASLDSMVKDTIRAYRDSDRPVVDVLVPEQDITSGVVQLVVVEGRLEAVRVQGATREEEDYLRRNISTEKGEVLRSSKLLNDLAWMNRSPYRRVDMVYAPGFRFGTTDIILRTNEVDPFNAYIGYENSGNELLGEHRLLAGATWAEAWGPDRTLSYQLTTDMDFDSITSHSLVYSMPLPWRHYATFLGAYVDSEADVDVDGTPLTISGESWQASTRYAMPIRFWAPDNWSHELEFGFDFKSSNNNLEFGGDEFFNATTHIAQLGMGYNVLQQDKTGATKFDLTGYLSPGGIDDNNTDETFQQARAGSSSNYRYLTASIERSQRIGRQATARFRAQGQLSSDNLLASEQLGIGGPSTVRGYSTSIARGDEGILLSGELYSPTYSVAQWFDWRYTSDELRFLVFADYASVSNVNLLEGEQSSQDLFSVGFGLRWTIDEMVRLRADIGFPISDDLPEGADVDDVRVHISATTTF